MSDERVEVGIGADIKELEAGTQEATSVIEQATSSWTSKFQAMFGRVSESATQMTKHVAKEAHEAGESLEGFNKKIEKVRGTMQLLAEVAVFGWIGDKIWELAEKTAEYAHEVETAAQKTGMSTDRLQGWGVAAQMAGGSMEGMLKGIRKFSQELIGAQEGSEASVKAFQKLGISGEELKGAQLDETMLKVADSFKEHADGAGKAALAQQLFGRAGQTLIPILNLGREGVEAYMKTAKDVGAVMSKEDVEGAANFKQHLELLGISVSGMGHKVGTELMPSLAGLVVAFQNSVQKGGQLNELMHILPAGINMVAKVVSYAAEGFQMMGHRLAAVAAIVDAVLHGNLAGAKAIASEFNKDFAAIKKGAEDFRAGLDKPINLPKIIKGEEEGGKKKDFAVIPKNEKDDQGESRVSSWEADLDRIKTVNKEFYAEDLAGDREYWAQVLAFDDLSANERISIGKKVFDLDKQIAREKVAVQMDALKDDSSLAKAGSLERIDIARQESALLKSTYGTNSKEYANSLREIDKEMKAYSDLQDKEAQERSAIAIERTKTTSLLMLDIEAEKIKQSLEMGEISEEESIAQLIELENKRYEVERQALQKKAELYQYDVKQFQEALAKMQELAIKHQLALLKIDKPLPNPYDKVFDQMTKGFDKALDGMLLKHTTFKQSLEQGWNQMVLSFAHMGVKMVADWAKHQLTQLTMTQATNAAKVVSDQEAADQGLLVTLWANIKKIASSAAAAAAGAYQAVVGIPYVGPVLAPIAAGVAFAGVMAFSAMASASGGYDIPTGINPMTQLHQEEMVLPANIANPLRDMVSGGGPGGGSATYNVKALDAKSFRQFLGNNKKALSGLHRDFGFVGGR